LLVRRHLRIKPSYFNEFSARVGNHLAGFNLFQLVGWIEARELDANHYIEWMPDCFLEVLANFFVIFFPKVGKLS
jgi:hypothetical protein